jgi:hypothetical protein
VFLWRLTGQSPELGFKSVQVAPALAPTEGRNCDEATASKALASSTLVTACANVGLSASVASVNTSMARSCNAVHHRALSFGPDEVAADVDHPAGICRSLVRYCGWVSHASRATPYGERANARLVVPVGAGEARITSGCRNALHSRMLRPALLLRAFLKYGRAKDQAAHDRAARIPVRPPYRGRTISSFGSFDNAMLTSRSSVNECLV